MNRAHLCLLTIVLTACAADLLEPRPPAEAGFEPDLGARVDAYVTRAIEERVFPGCQVLVARGNRIVLDEAWGHESYAQDAAQVTGSTRYDLASLSKVVATTGVAMALHARGDLRLDTPVATLLPSFGDGDRARITLRHLLTHSAGMPAWKPYYRTLRGRDAYLTRITEEPLERAPGVATRYSDLGFIVLGACLERLGGARLDRLAQELLFEPLGMSRTGYGPLGAEIRVAPTEVVAERGGTIRGRVHDENADAIGGVAGHAGLFSTAGDVARYVRAVAAGAPPFSPDTVALFTARQDLVAGSSRALGWDTWSPRSAAGARMSRRAWGHTGFTGTSVWVDPERDVIVVCLTNRVHPTRQNTRIHAFRRGLHDIVINALVAASLPGSR